MFLIFIILFYSSRSQDIINYALPGRPVSGNQLYNWSDDNYDYIYSFFGRNEDGSFSSGVEILAKKKDEDYSNLEYFNYDFFFFTDGMSQFGIFESLNSDYAILYGGINSYGISSEIYLYNMRYDFIDGPYYIVIEPRLNFAFTTFKDYSNSNLYFFILGGENDESGDLSDFIM